MENRKSSNNVSKILGLKWDSTNDTFQYHIPDQTKRNLLACIAAIFDLLGLISPVVLHRKLLLQNVQQIGIG